MEKNRLEPLGVPHSEYDFGSEFEQQARRTEPSRFDRWLIGQIRKRLGQSRVALALWDEADSKTADATVRFNDRGALWQILINPGLHFGDLYSAGRLSIHGDLAIVLDEAYRYVASLKVNNRLLRTLLAETSAWEEVTFEDPALAPISYAHPAQAV